MLVPMRSFERLVRGAAAALGALVLAACNNGTQACTAPPGVYNAAVIVTPVLVSPAPGATGVSTGPLDVTISSAFNATSLFVKDGSGNVTLSADFRQANPPATDVRIATFAQLAPHTTYQVYASVAGPALPQSSCGPSSQTSLAPQLLGSFTTTG